MAKFYAAQSPRGFARETNVYMFHSRSARNSWVTEHRDDGDTNSAYRGAYAITRKEAIRLTGYALDDAGFPDRSRVNATLIA